MRVFDQILGKVHSRRRPALDSKWIHPSHKAHPLSSLLETLEVLLPSIRKDASQSPAQASQHPGTPSSRYSSPTTPHHSTTPLLVAMNPEMEKDVLPWLRLAEDLRLLQLDVDVSSPCHALQSPCPRHTNRYLAMPCPAIPCHAL
jgi:hypothetical protein